MAGSFCNPAGKSLSLLAKSVLKVDLTFTSNIGFQIIKVTDTKMGS